MSFRDTLSCQFTGFCSRSKMQWTVMYRRTSTNLPVAHIFEPTVNNEHLKDHEATVKLSAVFSIHYEMWTEPIVRSCGQKCPCQYLVTDLSIRRWSIVSAALTVNNILDRRIIEEGYTAFARSRRISLTSTGHRSATYY